MGCPTRSAHDTDLRDTRQQKKTKIFKKTFTWHSSLQLRK